PRHGRADATDRALGRRARAEARAARTGTRVEPSAVLALSSFRRRTTDDQRHRDRCDVGRPALGWQPVACDWICTAGVARRDDQSRIALVQDAGDVLNATSPHTTAASPRSATSRLT